MYELLRIVAEKMCFVVLPINTQNLRKMNFHEIKSFGDVYIIAKIK